MTAVYGIFGAGGHGREIAWLAGRCGIPCGELRFVVDGEFAQQAVVNGIPVLEAADFTRRHPRAPVFVAIGDPHLRRRSAVRLEQAGHSFPSLIADRANLSPTVQHGGGVIVFPGATVTVDVKLGEHVHVNVNSSISHDVEIGAFTSVSPGASICGHVRIGHSVLIGAGACVINGTERRPLTIGDDAIVGAGACVIGPVPAGAKVVGVPARAV